MAALRIEPIDHTEPLVARPLHALQMAAYAQEARSLGITRFPPLERTLEDLQSSAEVFLAAFMGCELAGALGMSCDAPGKPTNIDSLVVMPSLQRRGVATALLAAAIARHGHGELTVGTAAKNAPALALYARAGFVEVRRWWTGDGALELVKLRRNPSFAAMTENPAP